MNIKNYIYKLRQYKPLEYIVNSGGKTQHIYVIGYKYPWQVNWKNLNYEAEYSEYHEAMKYIKENYG